MSQRTARGSSAERRDARAAAAAPDADGAFTHRQILTVLAGLMLGMFLAALDQTVVSTAIRTIADDLKGYDLQAWATTAFLITTPLYGKLSDLYGRRPFYLFAIGVFVVGSMLCGLADSMYSLAVYRAIQGIGAGGLMSLALSIIGDIVPLRERSRYQGFFMAVFGTSSVLGPVIGGFLAGQGSLLGITGWRWIFYVNVPLGLLAFVVVTLSAAPAAHAAGTPHRLAGGAGADHLPRAAADRRRAGPHLGLELRARRALLRDRRSRPGAVRPRRAGLRRRRSAAAPPVPAPQLRRRERQQRRPGRRHVRRHPAAAPIPADRAGLQPDSRRPANDPAGPRDHGRRHGFRHHDQPDRQVQGVPDRRHGVHRRRAGRDVVHRRRPDLGVGPGAVHGADGAGPGLQLPAGHPRRGGSSRPCTSATSCSSS